jgi:hypothetical protein
MTAYSLVLFLHVLAVALIVGAMGIAHFALHQLRSADRLEPVVFWLMTLRRLSVFFPAGSLLLLATGAELARQSARLTQGWVIAATVGLVLIVVLGATVNAAWGKRVGMTLAGARNGGLPAETRAALARPHIYVSARLTAGVVVGILFLMTVRPPGAVAAAVLAGGALLGAASALPMLGAAPAAGREAVGAIGDRAD